ARMEPIIQSHGGFVDKFIGDAIMALFEEGRGVEGQTSSDRAVACAVEMRKALKQFNELRARKGEQPLECGIGISTGLVVLGTVGSMERLDTTAIGDTVNLAARLESLTARFGLPVLISTSTMNTMTGSEKFKSRLLGTVTMKGKRRPVEIHEIFESDPPDTAQKKSRTGELIAQAFPLYVGREFGPALELFEKARDIYDETLLRQYVDRCKSYLEISPPEEWNGSEVMREK
ncbi:MAG TPA: adenylate/guanylate cyclase domain-containing protein, partial [Leptospiraceae bacterium]|nr:adenylate/guanylate cyclase domain-containing protein [Leptospiraceae bacterium]